MKSNRLKKLRVVLSIISIVGLMITGCSQSSNNSTGDQNLGNDSGIDSKLANEELPIINISFNGEDYDVILYDTETTRDLLAQIPSSQLLLPPSYDMEGTLKYYDLPRVVSTNIESIDSVKTGEVLLDGNDRLLIVYKDNQVSGNYTKVGYIEDTTGLAEALGSDEVEFLVSKKY